MAMLLITWTLSLVSLCGISYAVQTFFPPSIPLSVRSPYMSVWHISTPGSGSLGASGQHFWGQTQGSYQGWQGTIRIDNQTYIWLGDTQYIVANVTEVIISPTRSIFVMQTGPMSLNVTFFSPIEPDDLVKQSIPFSYVSVTFIALDGRPHDVQVYMGISSDWVTGNKTSNSVIAEWSQKQTSESIYLEIDLQDPQPYTEYDNQAQDGKAYCAMALGPNLTWQNGILQDIHMQFQRYGNLTNQEGNPAFGTINSPSTGVAFAVDLGYIQATSNPITWAIGYVRDPSVQFTTRGGEVQSRRPYFVTQYADINDVIDAVTTNFNDTNNRALTLDTKIMGAAANISPAYIDLVSLAALQTIGSLDFTVGSDSEGKVDASDVMAFMKDIGSFRTPRVNPVERIFAAFPMYLYLNASLCKFILAPLLEVQSSLKGQPYASYDLGAAYPIASGSRADPTLGIEESGNMLIMMYAHARYSGDGVLLSQYYSLTKRWADYLVTTTLTPNNQQSADDQTTTNATNLALKGIIGVKAMAEIARATGNVIDAEQYDADASALVGAWEHFAMSSSGSHLLGVYGDEASWSLLYNAYADLLLGTRLLPQSLLINQTRYYDSLFNTDLPVACSSAIENVSIPCNLFTAAIVTEKAMRDKLIYETWLIASNNTMFAFGIGDQYSNTPSNGIQVIGDAGPAAGAIYSLLALNIANMTILAPQVVHSDPPETCSDTDRDDCPRQSSIAPIVGGVIGGLTVVGISALVTFLLRRSKKFKLSPSTSVDLFEPLDCQCDAPAMSERFLRPNLENYQLPCRRTDNTSLDANLGSSTGLSSNVEHSVFQRGVLTFPQASHCPAVMSEAPQYHTTGAPVVEDTVRSAEASPHSPGIHGERGAEMMSLGSETICMQRLREELDDLRRQLQNLSLTMQDFEPPPEYRTVYDPAL